MTIAIIKNYKVASIPEMHRLTLKLIFAKHRMKYEEEVLLDNSIKKWSRKYLKTKDEKEDLVLIMTALIDEQKGKFDLLKESMKQHKLDYRKVFRGGL